MTHWSAPEVLLLHAVRVLGFASSTELAGRAGTSGDQAQIMLRDAQSRGWVAHFTFADLDGWTLTDSGKVENERQLTSERTRADPTGIVVGTYHDFIPLNARLLQAVTDWQTKPTSTDAMAANDHADATWDNRVLEELAHLGGELAPLTNRLSGVLARFDGYSSRYATAVRKARAGARDWVDATTVDSCHKVWFQLHEDLVATLGIDRRAMR